MFCFKMAEKQWNFVSQKSHLTKILKTTFPKKIFSKIWLKVDEHEYIYIFEIQFKKKKNELV